MFLSWFHIGLCPKVLCPPWQINQTSNFTPPQRRRKTQYGNSSPPSPCVINLHLSLWKFGQNFEIWMELGGSARNSHFSLSRPSLPRSRLASLAPLSRGSHSGRWTWDKKLKSSRVLKEKGGYCYCYCTSNCSSVGKKTSSSWRWRFPLCVEC